MHRAFFEQKFRREKCGGRTEERPEGGLRKVTMFPKSRDFFVERDKNFAFLQVYVDKLGGRC